MKKVCLFLLFFFTLSFCIGCSEKIKIKLIDYSGETIYTFNDNQEITEFLYNLLNDESVEGIYFDKKFKIKYENNEIVKGTVLYVNKYNEKHNILTIQNAYKEGLISIENVKLIFDAKREDNQAVLTEDLEYNIKVAVYNSLKKMNDTAYNNILFDDIVIKYFGDYNGYHGFCYTSKHWIYPDIMKTVEIGGQVFEFSLPQIMIYYEVR